MKPSDSSYLYAIGKESDLKPPYSNCYIGVTSNPKQRWNEHSKSEYFVGNAIRKYKLTFKNNFCIIAEGESTKMFALEESYRPVPKMGLNLSSGGQGGAVEYLDPAGRSRKISLALKGKKHSDERIEKMKATKKLNGTNVGAKNPKARTVIFTDPQGKEYKVVGGMEKFCEEHKINYHVMYRVKGQVVGPIKTGTFGGYRAKSEHSRMLRENTTGWKMNYIMEKKL